MPEKAKQDSSVEMSAGMEKLLLLIASLHLCTCLAGAQDCPQGQLYSTILQKCVENNGFLRPEASTTEDSSGVLLHLMGAPNRTNKCPGHGQVYSKILKRCVITV